MTLRTAPCPTCKNTIVFGERRCRACGMAYDYGAAPLINQEQLYRYLIYFVSL